MLYSAFLDIICSYVNKDREVTKRLVQNAERRGVKGLFITVDAPQLGRREKVPISISILKYAAEFITIRT